MNLIMAKLLWVRLVMSGLEAKQDRACSVPGWETIKDNQV